MLRDTNTTASGGSNNEELAVRIQAGDRHAAELLVTQNKGFITDLALKYTPLCELEDLKQEGYIALLEAAGRYDPSCGVKLHTYATPAIKAAMIDYGSRGSSALCIPPSRYHQLRKVAYLCADAQGDPESALIETVGEKMNVSIKAAKELLREYRLLFNIKRLGNDVSLIIYGGDPAKVYDRYMRRTLLFQLMEDVLTPRELNLVRCYLGINQPDDKGMTFQELAIRLNYNGPSGAEKAYKGALRKLREHLHSGVYGQWLSIQNAIREAKAEAEAETGIYMPPQKTWINITEQD